MSMQAWLPGSSAKRVISSHKLKIGLLAALCTAAACAPKDAPKEPTRTVADLYTRYGELRSLEVRRATLEEIYLSLTEDEG